MYLMIDNYDSFVYNLKAYFQELGREILVKRCDEITLEEIRQMQPDGIVLSPGPKRPWDAQLCMEIVERFQGKIPILGVCLGHQVLGHSCGATVQKGVRPMHGKVTEIYHKGTGLFAGLPERFQVTRYHSLIVKKDSIPQEYQVDALAEDGAVMGISHKTLPLYGVQFHPEAVLTEYGHELLENFCRLTEAWQKHQLKGERSREQKNLKLEKQKTIWKNRTDGEGKQPGSMSRIVKKLEEYIPAAELFRYFQKEADCVFLDSSLVNQLGRYSIIGRCPYEKLVKDGDRFTVNGVPEKECSFEEYMKAYLEQHIDQNETGLPIVSGAIGYFSYDYGREQQKVVSGEPDIVSIPEAAVTFYDSFIIEDCQKKEIYLVTNGMTKDAKGLLQETEEICAQISKKLKCEDSGEKGKDGVPAAAQEICGEKEISEFTDENPVREKKEITITPNFEKEEYKQAVADMIQYIIEGDIYIANMTQQLTIESSKDPLDVFYDLRRDNPSPFGGYLNYGDYQIVCASPERFLKMKEHKVNTRPIKGTRKRGETPEEDRMMREELQNSGKDQSELLMIVDLERNDLNRVCVPGSVKVTELFTVEEYATVFHLVSDIEGQLQEGKNVMDLLESAFPGGSITGAPKYRAMEIIDELEHGRRNLYTGSIGYLTLDGACDFNIVIRTALHKNGRYYLGVGGGITAESDLEFEYDETLQKAKAVLEALQ